MVAINHFIKQNYLKEIAKLYVDWKFNFFSKSITHIQTISATHSSFDENID